MLTLQAIGTILLLGCVTLQNLSGVQTFSFNGRMRRSPGMVLVPRSGMPSPSPSPLAYVTSSSSANHNSQYQYRHRCRSLKMSDSPQVMTGDEVTEGREDPLTTVTKNFESMNLNGIINTSILLGVTGLALSRLATVDLGITRGWSAAEMALRIPVDNWLGYTNVLENSPVITKAVTSATVYTIGDLIAQKSVGTSMEELDRPRILRSLLAGLIGHGPMSHVWYDVSEYFFNDIFGWTEWWGFIPKVIVDQALWGPLWNNTYIILLGLMKMDHWETIWSDVKRTTIPLIISGLKLWPLAHCVTYGLVPVENRLLWVDLVEIIWVVILATTASSDVAHDGAHDAPAPDTTTIESNSSSIEMPDKEIASETIS